METVIIICLLIIIFLLMQDQAANKKRPPVDQTSEVKKEKLRSIMGAAKGLIVRSDNKEFFERDVISEITSSHTEDVSHQERTSPIQMQKEELDEVFADPVDLEAEEEEWIRRGIMDNHTNLAQGVTFEEMHDAGRLLRCDILPSAEKKVAVTLVQKIHGTELYNLLKDSVEGASKKIAELLEASFSESDKANFTYHHTDDPTEFDINQFI
ncbi:conjugal transfer protein TraD [Chryseobacterium wangxinyae]|uniref:conjugal transfer protein TraD n=1 Tax=Chryseobacterium sp. CY350 TaxID=2997336 RepID=UPI00226E4BDC|nr:conjugal transfer protein TraD [Chryseobacterium sp. CY350]MCY0976849.1 conjugal transfer protein TraD [Chryseobacterium sp. CY350]WBZ96849.1 conjugal transfer protein TraD [Chryseobacterium sp. CY350]